MPTESLYPPILVPNVDIFGLLFEGKDRRYPEDKVIYRNADTSRSYTYADVKQAAISFGAGLKAMWDWQKGDILALFTPNCIDTPAVIWGCLWAGGILSPANPGYMPDELAFQLDDAGAKALVTQRHLLPIAQQAARRVGIPDDRIILLGDERDPSIRFKHFTSIRNIAGTSRYRRTRLNPEKDLAFLVYSSGTTGYPKGVMLSHGNIVANILMLSVGEGNHLTWNDGESGTGDNVLAVLPFFHIYGLSCILHQALYHGLTATVMPKFDIEKFCSVIQNHRITYAYVVPPIVLLLSKHPLVDKYDLSSLRMLSCAAAPLTQELIETVYKRLKIPIRQGYGLSEASPITHIQPWELWDKAIGSVGRLLPNQTAKYMSPGGTEVPVGDTGELWVKGPNVFQGYHNNTESTHNSLTPDGYLKTGDVGHQDRDGNFYITDRVKELIKYKGFQVAPAELEGLLVSHPLVNDVAVIGVYDADRATEVPRAYVVPAPNVTAGSDTATELTEWLASKVAAHKRLRGGVRFLDVVPKSASGKILRRLLKVKAVKEEGEEEATEPEQQGRLKAKL